MHNVTRLALLEVLDKRRPEPELYDQCIDLALRLNTTLRRVQLEIIGELLSTDSLTGCASRRGMLVRLREEQERSLRIQRPCCLCLLDFDHFKLVNDERGHPAGDAVLRQSLRFVTGVLRKYDSIYRYGGEEFLICHETHRPFPRHQPGHRAGAVRHHAFAGRRALPERKRPQSGALLIFAAVMGFGGSLHLAGHVQMDGEEVGGRPGDRPTRARRTELWLVQTVRA
jgi:GGDEF domain-containing protein